MKISNDEVLNTRGKKLQSHSPEQLLEPKSMSATERLKQRVSSMKASDSGASADRSAAQVATTANTTSNIKPDVVTTKRPKIEEVVRPKPKLPSIAIESTTQKDETVNTPVHGSEEETRSMHPNYSWVVDTSQPGKTNDVLVDTTPEPAEPETSDEELAVLKRVAEMNPQIEDDTELESEPVVYHADTKPTNSSDVVILTNPIEETETEDVVVDTTYDDASSTNETIIEDVVTDDVVIPTDDESNVGDGEPNDGDGDSDMDMEYVPTDMKKARMKHPRLTNRDGKRSWFSIIVIVLVSLIIIGIMFLVGTFVMKTRNAPTPAPAETVASVDMPVKSIDDAKEKLSLIAEKTGKPYEVDVYQLGGKYISGVTTYYPANSKESYVEYDIVAPKNPDAPLTTDEAKVIEGKLSASLPTINDNIKVKDGKAVTMATYKDGDKYQTILFYNGKVFAFVSTDKDGNMVNNVTTYYVKNVQAE